MRSRLLIPSLAISASMLPKTVLAADDSGPIPAFINYYGILAGWLSLPADVWVPIFSFSVVLGIVAVVGVWFKNSVERDGDDVAPKRRFSGRYLIESILEFVHGIAVDNCGEKYRSFLPLLAGLFVFILFTNLTGLIPGFPPATEVISTNIAMGLVVFAVYNYAGIKEHGAGYIKHFLGPAAFIAPIFFVIELVSHLSRPLSLGLRLAGNIFGDHLLLGVFTGLSYFVVPVALMFFGLLVAVVQSFIFTLLSGIYISMAISHDH